MQLKLRSLMLISLVLAFFFLAGFGNVLTLRVFASSDSWSSSGFVRIYDEGSGYVSYVSRAIETSDGGYMITGSTFSSSQSGWVVWLLKTDAGGNVQWNKTYADNSVPADIIQTNNGDYVITGLTGFSSGSIQPWLLKIDSIGTVQWSKMYAEADREITVNSFIETQDGGYAIAGSIATIGAGTSSACLLKIDAFGNVIWNQTYAESINSAATSIAQSSDHGYILAGYAEITTLGNSNYDLYLVKTDLMGNPQWSRVYNEEGIASGLSIRNTADGGYEIIGSNSLVKTDENGIEEWNETFASEATAVVQTIDSGFAMAGTEQLGSNQTVMDIWLDKIDVAGNLQWNRTFELLGRLNLVNTVIQTKDGGYCIVGTTENNTGALLQPFLIRTDGNGIIPEITQLSGLLLLFVSSMIAVCLVRKLRQTGLVNSDYSGIFQSACIDTCGM